MEHLFFSDWSTLLRILIVGLVSYAALILLLRAAGKRTLSRMNAYDMVVTMALGSILAKVLLTKDQSIAEGVTAMVVLIGLQYAVSVGVRHFPQFQEFVSAKPTVLFHEGTFISEALRRERVSREEVQAAIHSKGISDNALVDAVILGRNGDLSVLLKHPQPLTTTIRPAGDL